MPMTAFVFPGQGSQRAGMGRDLVEEHPDLLDRYYRLADDLLGFPLSALCFAGSQEDLRRTEITQPAVFLTSVVALDVLRRRGVEPAVVAGHSLGEYAALVAAGVLEWTEALLLVRRRGELMAAVNATAAGSMTAITGLTQDVIDGLCADVQERTGATVVVANDNDPSQLVVSGHASAVAAVADLARANGAERVIPLDVDAAFHSSLMSVIQPDFDLAVARVTFREPRLPVVANVTAAPISSGAEAAECLRAQLAGRVRWTETLRRLAADGVDGIVEVGPGRVLGGFVRTTCPEIPAYAGGELRRINQAVRALVRDPAPAGTAELRHAA